MVTHAAHAIRSYVMTPQGSHTFPLVGYGQGLPNVCKKKNKYTNQRKYTSQCTNGKDAILIVTYLILSAQTRHSIEWDNGPECWLSFEIMTIQTKVCRITWTELDYWFCFIALCLMRHKMVVLYDFREQWRVSWGLGNCSLSISSP